MDFRDQKKATKNMEKLSDLSDLSDLSELPAAHIRHVLPLEWPRSTWARHHGCLAKTSWISSKKTSKIKNRWLMLAESYVHRCSSDRTSTFSIRRT